jgi:hypothetical protein
MIASLGPMLIASTLTSPIMAASAADANPVLADALHLPGDTEAIEPTAHAAARACRSPKDIPASHRGCWRGYGVVERAGQRFDRTDRCQGLRRRVAHTPVLVLKRAGQRLDSTSITQRLKRPCRGDSHPDILLEAQCLNQPLQITPGSQLAYIRGPE